MQRINLKCLRTSKLINASSRMPKDAIIADQWKLVVSRHLVHPTSLDKVEKGLICAEHFEPSAFKRKNKSQLKKGSIPTIFGVVAPAAVAIVTTSTTASTVASASANLTIATDATDQPNIDTICVDCENKDDIIEFQRKKIEDLRAKVKQLNDKTYYLGRAKEKISASLNKIKQDKLVDDNLFRQLQVKPILFVFKFHYIYNVG